MPPSPAEFYGPGHIRRHMVHVPKDATWASLTLTAGRTDQPQRFTIHTVQLKPHCSVRTIEFYKVGRRAEGGAVRNMTEESYLP